MLQMSQSCDFTRQSSAELGIVFGHFDAACTDDSIAGDDEHSGVKGSVSSLP
jgi:hypothetical protein